MQDDHNSSTPDTSNEPTEPSDRSTPSGEKKDWLDDPGNVSKIFYGIVAVCALLLAADLFYDKHAESSLELYFGFSAFFGFVSYVFIVFAAKQLRKILMRPEDYYDR